MSVTLSPPMFLQFFSPNNSGAPAAGYLLFTYIAGTSTKQATWTDSTQTVQNANPIVLDSNGAAYVWGDPTLSYKFVFCQPNDTDPPTSPLRTVDNIQFPVNLDVFNQAFIGELLYPQTPAEMAAHVTPVNFAYPPDPRADARRYGFSTINSADQNTQALTNAISVVAGGNGEILLPAGHFNLTAPINIPDGVIVIGAGLENTILATTSSIIPLIQIGGIKSGVLKYGCGFRDCEITLSDSAGKAIQLMETVGAVVKNVYIQGPITASRSTKGLVIDGGDASAFFNIIENVECAHVHIGFDTLTSGAVEPTANTFIDISASGDVATDVTSIGFRIQGVVAQTGNGTTVHAADMEACQYGYYLTAGCGPTSYFGARGEGNTDDVYIETNAASSSWFGGILDIDGGHVLIQNGVPLASSNTSHGHQFIGVANGDGNPNDQFIAGSLFFNGFQAGDIPIIGVATPGAGAGTAILSLQNSAGNLLFEINAGGKFKRVANADPATVTGSKGGNAALGSLITTLANYGLVVDGSS